jgi:tetratricopeptide (TPR) repeat protein
VIRELCLAALGLVLGSGCSSHTQPTVPVDPILKLHARGGELALAAEHPDQAVDQFREGLAQARMRDDAAAIADLGFDLALAQLQSGQPAAALATAQETQAGLIRRGTEPTAELKLAEAIALYRLGGPTAADTAAAQVQRAGEPKTSSRASFLRGLIDDDRGDTAGLERALSAIAVTLGPEQQADAAELSARLALRQGNIVGARAEALRASNLRRDLLDYHSLARSLALAARAAELANDTPSAADLYFRAGRTAADQNDTDSAKRWLGQAIALSRDPSLTQDARSALASVEGSNR